MFVCKVGTGENEISLEALTHSLFAIFIFLKSDDNSKVQLLPTEGAASAPQTHTSPWKRSPRGSWTDPVDSVPALVITRIAAEK